MVGSTLRGASEVTIPDFISLAGDFGVWAVVAVLWRFDRRILRVEVKLDDHIESEELKLDWLIARARAGHEDGP